MKFIGLDIGTTSIGGVVFDTDQAKVLDSVTVKNEAALAGNHTWERIQDPEVIYNHVTDVLHSLIQHVPDIDGIGLTGQMHGIVYTNTVGQHVSPLYTWQDQRGGLIYQEQLTYAQWLSRVTGYALSPGYGLVTHLYNVTHALVPNHAVSLSTIADYIVMRLTSSFQPFLDPTQAAGIGCYHDELMTFDQHACITAGLDVAFLPRIVPSGTQVGITAQGIPVFTSMGDNQASFLGCVKDVRDSLLLNIGTGGQISLFSPAPLTDTAGLEQRPFPGGGVLLVGASLCGGKAYAMLERFFRQVIEQYTGMPAQDVYSLMNDLMNIAPTEQIDGLHTSTQFLGTRANPELRGQIEQITLDNFTPGNVTRSFLEGMIDELYGYYKNMPILPHSSSKHLVGSGNAIRINRELREVAEHAFGLALEIPASQEEGAVGAALSAAVGRGAISSFLDAGKFLHYETR